QHFTESKAMCWVALDRAAQLAETGHLSDRRRQRWLTEAAAIRAFIDNHCWSERLGSYVRYAGREELDASLLMMPIMRYDEPTSPRLAGTIEAVRRELGRGALVYRYTGEDGLAGAEGVFVCCSFWLAEALALAGRRDDAARSMAAARALAHEGQGPRLRPSFRGRDGLLARVLRDVPRDRARRLAARDDVRSAPLAVRRQRARQRAAPRHPSQDGHAVHRGGFVTTARAARLHAAQLWTRDADRHRDRPSGLRGDRGRRGRYRSAVTTTSAPESTFCRP